MLAIANPGLAGPKCSDEPKARWLSESEMMQRIAPMGHRVELFKTTTGNCYEIYGRDKSGRRIEVYFHPLTGNVVKSSVP